MDLYFKRHDGQAVTCDDFLAAMADANGVDLSQMARWYAQAGTPRLHVSSQYDAGELHDKKFWCAGTPTCLHNTMSLCGWKL